MSGLFSAQYRILSHVTKNMITKRRDIPCSVCGKSMHVVFYKNRKYRSGHYFGKVPLYSKSELAKMSKSGTHPSKITPTWTIDVCNYDPKPYAHFEYWECPDCYWHPKSKSSQIQQTAIKATLKKKRGARS